MSQQNSVSLSVKDFQIIKNANLSFLPGLNCIIGQSNNGKSALMRAAKACIYNTPGSTNVRLGCSNFAVGLQMNGHTVILQKGNNSLYKVDNEVYGKIGRTQLEEVANALGVKELQINGANEDINFWDQMEKPFLLDRSETELFRFIVDSGKDNNVTTALKTITQDRQQITKDISLTEGKIAAIEANILKQEEELKDADKKLDICNRVVELGPKIKRVQELSNLKSKSLSDGQNLSIALNNKNILTNLLSNIESKLDTISSTSRKINLISSLVNNYNSKQLQLNTLSTQLNKMKSLDVPDLNEKLKKYKLLSELISKSRSTSDLITELSNKKFPELSSDFNDKANKLTSLGALIDSIKYKQQQISTLEDSKITIEKELNEVKEEINKIGICPTCGQPLHNN
jgi:DNA repair ATPase RecN